MFDRAWHFGFRYRGVMPLPVRAQIFTGSTVASKKPLRKPLAYKLPKLAHRAVNETRRGLHYISRGLFIPRCSWPPSSKSDDGSRQDSKK
jgi:hypothetical protein